MSSFQDIKFPSGSAFIRKDGAKIEQMRIEYPKFAEDYINFVEDVGYGEIGTSQFMLYGALVDPYDIYGNSNEKELEGVLLFGDDFAGYCVGFDMQTGKVVEICPSDRSIEVVADCFSEFLAERLKTFF